MGVLPGIRPLEASTVVGRARSEQTLYYLGKKHRQNSAGALSLGVIHVKKGGRMRAPSQIEGQSRQQTNQFASAGNADLLENPLTVGFH